MYRDSHLSGGVDGGRLQLQQRWREGGREGGWEGVREGGRVGRCEGGRM